MVARIQVYAPALPKNPENPTTDAPLEYVVDVAFPVKVSLSHTHTLSLSHTHTLSITLKPRVE